MVACAIHLSRVSLGCQPAIPCSWQESKHPGGGIHRFSFPVVLQRRRNNDFAQLLLLLQVMLADNGGGVHNAYRHGSWTCSRRERAMWLIWFVSSLSPSVFSIVYLASVQFCVLYGPYVRKGKINDMFSVLKRSSEVCDGILLPLRVCCVVFNQSLRNRHDRYTPVELFCSQQGMSLVLPFLFKLGHEAEITLVAPAGRFLLDVGVHVCSYWQNLQK